jgi:hypothetical protein
MPNALLVGVAFDRLHELRGGEVDGVCTAQAGPALGDAVAYQGAGLSGDQLVELHQSQDVLVPPEAVDPVFDVLIESPAVTLLDGVGTSVIEIIEVMMKGCPLLFAA